MFRMLTSLIFMGAVAYGGFWVWENVPEVRTFVEKHLDMGKEFHTLEARFSSDQIMDRHRTQLLKDEQYSYAAPELIFFPYALMEVKYTDSGRKTRESVILWGLEDGEMVVDTSTWEKTHGFEDCLVAGADRNDYRIIGTLARNGNVMGREALASALYVQEDLLDQWLDNARKKRLVVMNGNDVRLHFQEPKLQVKPETKLNQSLVTKSHRGSHQIARRYNLSQIEKGAQSAFGQDFTIRRVTEVYLPVHRVTVQNPDGSVLTSHWNALNGQRIDSGYF